MVGPRRCLAFAGLWLALLSCASAPPAASDRPRRTVLLTEQDDVRAGREAAGAVAVQIGVLDDPALKAYLNEIGRKLLRGVPNRGFDFQFNVVDQLEPNAFALPGGFIFVSRGLLLLANNEDQLACVMGHEIGHVVRRHAARQQAIAQSASPLSLPWMRAGQMAAYSRDMERQADEDGQLLCAAAGYDPRALGSFLTSLELAERLRQGTSRTPGFFDTHPGSVDRVAASAVRASQIRWQRDPTLGDSRAALLKHTEGLAVGPRPESGIFEGSRFLHPVLGFEIRFPSGWSTANTNQMVGAMEPKGEAMVYLTGDLPAGDPKHVAETWLARARKESPLDVQESVPVKVGSIDAYRMLLDSSGRGGSIRGYVTFVPFGPTTYRITGIAPSFLADQHLPRVLVTMRSFRPLSEADRHSIKAMRLRVATARSGEDLAALGQRTNNAWDSTTAAVFNGLPVDQRFRGGELVKTAQVEAYALPKN
ncbi:MAG TPA: M48 family metalloprotease [Methanomassiliicoccales archaeon]|nr:M48 family metalloprotease [Methanomassiliicoccales archaeon]